MSHDPHPHREPAIRDIAGHFLSGLRPAEMPKRTPPTPQVRPEGSGHDATDAATPDAVAGPIPLRDEPEPTVRPDPERDAMHADDYVTRYGLSPAEFEPLRQPIEEDAAPAALGRPVRAVIGAELGEGFLDAAREYACSLVAGGGRVGLVLIDNAEVRLHLVEHDPAPAALPPERPRPTTGRLEEPALRRRVNEALAELDYDVDRWLLLLPDARDPRAADLVADTLGLTVLTRCSHDGVVAGYRTIKRAIADLGDALPADVSVALLDAKGDAEARAVHAKLADVAEQFLDCPLATEGRVVAGETVSEHSVLWLRHRGTAMAEDVMLPPTGAQWELVGRFLADSRDARAAEAVGEVMADEPQDQPQQAEPAGPVHPQWAEHPQAPAGEVAEPVYEQPMYDEQDLQDDTREDESPMVAMNPNPVVKIADAAPAMPRPAADVEPAASASGVGRVDDVIDLPGGSSDPAAVLRAALAGSGDLAATAIVAPMCPGGLVALDRDGTLTLIAATDADLAGLSQVSAALTWLTQSAGVIRMAMPQMHVADAAPRLRLLVDHRAANASGLEPLLATGLVTLVPYRTLKWGGKTGLLLNAA